MLFLKHLNGEQCFWKWLKKNNPVFTMYIIRWRKSAVTDIWLQNNLFFYCFSFEAVVNKTVNSYRNLFEANYVNHLSSNVISITQILSFSFNFIILLKTLNRNQNWYFFMILRYFWNIECSVIKIFSLSKLINYNEY